MLEKNILAIRNAEVVRDTVNDTRTVTTTRTSTRQIGWYDPLAQSFLVAEEGGVFLSSVDIFFKTKDSNIPISMQIRTMENGYPSKEILPFSDCTVDSDQIELSDNAAIPSRFTLGLLYTSRQIQNIVLCFYLTLMNIKFGYPEWVI